MRTVLTFFCLISALLLTVQADGPDAVIAVDSKNFDDILKNSEYLVLELFSPYCPHCTMFAPVYKEFAESAAHIYPDIKITAVDCFKDKELAVRFRITAVPTILIFQNGDASQFIKFEGNRDANSLLDWLDTITDEPHIKQGVDMIDS